MVGIAVGRGSQTPPRSFNHLLATETIFSARLGMLSLTDFPRLRIIWKLEVAEVGSRRKINETRREEERASERDKSKRIGKSIHVLEDGFLV